MDINSKPLSPSGQPHGQPWTVALIGAGYMAREYMKVFTAREDFHVVSVLSRTAESANSVSLEFGIPFVCKSVDELFQVSQADVVVVTTPEFETESVLNQAFLYPWLVLVEKPAGYNWGSALRLSEQAHNRAERVFVAFNRRFYSSTVMALSELQSDPGARILDVLDQEFPAHAYRNGTPKVVAENWMYANSVHLIDLIRYFARGSVDGISVSTRSLGLSSYATIAEIEFSSGDFCRYLAMWNAPGPWGVSITTSSARHSLQPLESLTVQTLENRIPTTQEPSRNDLQFKPGLWRLIDELSIQLADGASKLPTLSDSLETMRLISSIYPSIAIVE